MMTAAASSKTSTTSTFWHPAPVVQNLHRWGQDDDGADHAPRTADVRPSTATRTSKFRIFGDEKSKIYFRILTRFSNVFKARVATPHGETVGRSLAQLKQQFALPAAHSHFHHHHHMSHHHSQNHQHPHARMPMTPPPSATVVGHHAAKPATNASNNNNHNTLQHLPPPWWP